MKYAECVEDTAFELYEIMDTDLTLIKEEEEGDVY